MSKSHLTIPVRLATPTTAILDITGDVTGVGEDALMGAYTQASTGGVRTICLNFTGLDYMNSSGIGLLVTLLIRVQRQKQRLVAYGLTDHYLQIFELTRLNEAIGIYDSEAAALAGA
jgi:anti-sigma B factor antagonist